MITVRDVVKYLEGRVINEDVTFSFDRRDISDSWS
jgi:hypothetical protein